MPSHSGSATTSSKTSTTPLSAGLVRAMPAAAWAASSADVTSPARTRAASASASCRAHSSQLIATFMSSPLVEQREVDRVAHLAIAAVARVQSIAAIVDTAHLGRDLGVAQRGVEIGDAVEGAAVADPGIDRDPVLFPRRVPGVGHVGLVAERRQGCADQLDAGAAGARRHLLQ